MRQSLPWGIISWCPRKIIAARISFGISKSLSGIWISEDSLFTFVSNKRTLPSAKSSTLRAAGTMRIRFISIAVSISGFSMRSISKLDFRYSFASDINCMSRIRATVCFIPCFLASMQETIFTSSLAVTAISTSESLISGSSIVIGLEPLASIVITSSVSLTISKRPASWSTTTMSYSSLDNSSAIL